MYWGLPHFADYLGQGLYLRSNGAFPGLAVATLTSPVLQGGCRDGCPKPQGSKDKPSRELLSLSSLWHRGARVQPVAIWGQLHPAHLEDGTPAVRSSPGKEELLQDFP